MMAAGAGHDSVVAVLLDHNADATIVDQVRFLIMSTEVINSMYTFECDWDW